MNKFSTQDLIPVFAFVRSGLLRAGADPDAHTGRLPHSPAEFFLPRRGSKQPRLYCRTRPRKRCQERKQLCPEIQNRFLM